MLARRLLGRYFGAALSGVGGQAWSDISADLKQATCHGQHTYIFAQAFLAALGQRSASCTVTLAHMQEVRVVSAHCTMSTYTTLLTRLQHATRCWGC